MRILLVEDEVGLAGPLVALLRRERYEVGWADNTTQARAYVDEHEPDLIALDVMLPEGEDAGFDLARQLRLGGFTGAILFLTARDAVEDRVYGLDLGGDDYLVKPFSLEEFLARVRALLRRGGPPGRAFSSAAPCGWSSTAERSTGTGGWSRFPIRSLPCWSVWPCILSGSSGSMSCWRKYSPTPNRATAFCGYMCIACGRSWGRM